MLDGLAIEDLWEPVEEGVQNERPDLYRKNVRIVGP